MQCRCRSFIAFHILAHHVLQLQSTHASMTATADTRSTAAADGVISIDASAVETILPAEMSGAGCGIEYLNHQIDGGLFSQMVADESFELPLNLSTGLTTQWVGSSRASLVQDDHSGALNGRHFLRLAPERPSLTAWAENRGLNRWGLSWQAGRNYEGSVWLANPGAATLAVRVALVCAWAAAAAQPAAGGVDSTHRPPHSQTRGGGAAVAETAFAVAAQTGWREYRFNLTAGAVRGGGGSSSCAAAADGGFLVELLPARERPGAEAGAEAAAADALLHVDFVTVMPGAWGLYRNLPVRRDLATMLIEQMQPTVLRMVRRRTVDNRDGREPWAAHPSPDSCESRSQRAMGAPSIAARTVCPSTR